VWSLVSRIKEEHRLRVFWEQRAEENIWTQERYSNYWVFGLCPSSSILETREHNVSETRCYPSPEDKNRSTFRNTVFSIFLNTRRLRRSKNPVILSIIHHCQNSSESTKRDGNIGGWRELHNEELQNLYVSPYIIRMIKWRMGWAEHLSYILASGTKTTRKTYT
jgi:hypothetical protein